MLDFLRKLISYFLDAFRDGNRTSLRFNIILSFGARVVSVLVSFVTVPILLDRVDPTRYGIWLALSSILQWISFFDFGLGNGLRNKLAVSLANNDHKKVSEYLSTSYVVSSAISAGICVLFTICFYLFDISKLLNGPPEIASEVNKALLLLGCLQAVKFSVDIINYLLISDQRIGVANIISCVSAILVSGTYIVYADYAQLTLINLSFISLTIPIVVLIIASIVFFRRRYAIYKLSVANINFPLIRDVFELGLRFLVMQLSALIVLTTQNVIISNLFGPEDVIPYNVAYKYFGLASFLFVIVLSPLWSAFTKEYTLGNINWIKSTIWKMIAIWGFISVGTIAMLVLSNFFYSVWLHDEVQVPTFLSVNIMLFVIISNWNNIFAFFLNGVSKIQLQLITGILTGILNIPLSIFLARNCNLGPTGVIMATWILLFISSILQPIQTAKILNNTARGIWNR